MEQNDKNKIISCPRCKSFVVEGDTCCNSCGYAFANERKKNIVTKLRFGKRKPSVAVNVIDENSVEYKQEQTKRIKVLKIVYNYLFLLIGVMAIFMVVLPIFSKVNVWTQASNMSQTYGFELKDYFKLSNKSNFITIVRILTSFKNESDKILNPSYLMFMYNFLIFILLISVIIIGIFTLIFSLKALIFKIQYVYSKRIVSALLTISLLMIFGLNCYGVGPILLAFLCTSFLVFLYVGGILSGEKVFITRHIIHKSICFVAIMLILFFSSFGLINLNATLGERLYNFAPIAEASTDLAPKYVACKGVFLEIMQFVQCSSGDKGFTNVTFAFNILSLIFHAGYLVLGIIACVSILKSMSKQNLKFPVYKMIVSTIAFYAFSISLIVFNKLVNEAVLNKYINEVGVIRYNALPKEQQNSIRFANYVFTLRPGFIISMIVYLPSCIYAIIARKICLKNNSAKAR